MAAPASDSEQASSRASFSSSLPKPLRFVTSCGAPNPKRRRIGAACLTCRKRKTACSGDRPLCDTCTQNKLECAGYGDEQQDGVPEVVTRRKASVSQKPNGGGLRKRAATRVKDEPLQDSVDNEDARSSRPVMRDTAPLARKVQSHATEDVPNGHERHSDSLFAGPRNRMPYFRWLGPTAIMPGFKQMVVKVKRNAEVGRSSADGAVLSPAVDVLTGLEQRVPNASGNDSSAIEHDVRTPLELPFYDTSSLPPGELITHLASTFFTHLGCNYPFLQRERFTRDLEEKQVDAILVDAVCALAARFSTHALLTKQAHDESNFSPAEYGHAFAQRAKTALVDTFPCPSVAVVQAALLLAYNEFGEGRDSGLWMYLGISIRMAQDLGIHKLEGLRYVGMHGPTPKMVKRAARLDSISSTTSYRSQRSIEAEAGNSSPELSKASEEQRSVEQERVDTFWAIFFLDRVVSSGTGRRSTLRDKDIELSFPPLEGSELNCGWPAPFPAVIRIVHLYGRVADLLNSIKEPSDITPDTPERLATMENQVTQFYQGLSPRLHFDAVNFQHYMKAGEGTNFVLLHFWFHLLIVLLHQPTLLKTFEGRMLQLFPNSQQLSMSSAKTIADILSYSHLMDAKASLGNPFTTQPIYIAACAFLKETAEQTATSNAQSRAASPVRNEQQSVSNGVSDGSTSALLTTSAAAHNGSRLAGSGGDKQAIAKHTLLATAATQHYRLCYKALQSLETYWSGTKYILTVLDQKFEGVGDPLLYTVEEGESSMERPRPEPSFTSPGWRRKLSWGPYLAGAGISPGHWALQNPFAKSTGAIQMPGSPKVDPAKAIGWTLTGTLNSPSTNLAWHYPFGSDEQTPQASQNGSALTFEANSDGQHQSQMSTHQSHLPANATHQMHPPLLPFARSNTTATTAEADLLLGLGSPYRQDGGNTRLPSVGAAQVPQIQQTLSGPASYNGMGTMMVPSMFNNVFPDQPGMQHFSGDMMIESQEMDMSMLGLDMMPWFDSYPSNELGMIFGPTDTTPGSGGAT